MMDDQSLESVEQQLASITLDAAPSSLRDSILAEVHRELRAERRDRRLLRMAAALLVAGAGLNLAVGWQNGNGTQDRQPLAQARTRQSLVDAAMVVAAATDAQTGSLYARQLAAMMGHSLTNEETAAIEAAARYSSPHGSNGNKG